MNEIDRLLGNLAGKIDIVLEEKLKIVEQHIAKFETWGPNEAMLHRLRNALNIYHPEVIEAFPDEFNHNWRNAWGINR